eukprot:scaffold158602_cov37-Tisochrysis_lutea.AAC.1
MPPSARKLSSNSEEISTPSPASSKRTSPASHVHAQGVVALKGSMCALTPSGRRRTSTVLTRNWSSQALEELIKAPIRALAATPA